MKISTVSFIYSKNQKWSTQKQFLQLIFPFMTISVFSTFARIASVMNTWVSPFRISSPTMIIAARLRPPASFLAAVGIAAILLLWLKRQRTDTARLATQRSEWKIIQKLILSISLFKKVWFLLAVYKIKIKFSEQTRVMKILTGTISWLHYSCYLCCQVNDSKAV